MEKINSKDLSDFGFAKVLVVDDMPSNLVVAAGLLKKFGIAADCVNNGKDALDRIQSGVPCYDIIFMDYLMPGMDGMETVRKIRALDSEYAKNVPIVAMTGEEGADSADLFLKNGFQIFMAKPMSVAKLEPLLNEWLHKPR